MTARAHISASLPAKGTLSLFSRYKSLQMNLKRRYPALLGLPIMGPYVQFYRQDDAFSTELSLFNFYSTFLPNTQTQLTCHVVAYDRQGKQIGSGDVVLEHAQSRTISLEQVIGKKIDEYGLFHVQVSARCADPVSAAAIGPTTGQFMTLFKPRQIGGATQFVHSHKLFQAIPIPYSPYTRTTSFTDDYSTKSSSEFFFLNPCLSATTIHLNVLDSASGKHITKRSCTINKCGVGRITLTAEDVCNTSGQLSFTYEFDRRISHMKPIVFHHHADGMITCNHT